jgi:nuclear GTP-binding protein
MAKKKGDSIAVTADVDEEMEEAEPLLVDPSIPDLQSALDNSDVWLYVLDARDPQAHRSTFIESLATEKHKRLVFLLNKIGMSLWCSVDAS